MGRDLGRGARARRSSASEAELKRLRAAELRLLVRVAGLERARVGGGVNVAAVSTADIRAAFGWPDLPTPLTSQPES